MLLGLVPKDRIRAVSFEADSDTSFAVPRAHVSERLRPQLEDLVPARPAVVVRRYGGDARPARPLRALCIRVVQLGFPMSFAAYRPARCRRGREQIGRAASREKG